MDGIFGKDHVQFRFEATDKELSLILPCLCSDIKMFFRDAFHLGDYIGQNAFAMPIGLSQPGIEERLAAEVQIIALDQRYLAIFFKETKRLTWSRNVALIVAERICAASEQRARGVTQIEAVDLTSEVWEYRNGVKSMKQKNKKWWY